MLCNKAGVYRAIAGYRIGFRGSLARTYAYRTYSFKSGSKQQDTAKDDAKGDTPAAPAVPKEPLSRSLLKLLVLFCAGSYVSWHYSAHEISSWFMPELPEDEKSKKAYNAKLEARLHELDIVKKLSQDTSLIQTRSWESFNTISSLPIETQTATPFSTSLTEPGGISIAPLVFNDAPHMKSHVIIYLGQRLSGYPMIVHGGILGLLVDEVFKKSCLAEFELPDVNQLHTAKSTINYKFPTFVDQFALFETECSQIGPDRYQVDGTIKSAKNGRLLAKAQTIVEHGELKPSELGTTQAKIDWRHK